MTRLFSLHFALALNLGFCVVSCAPKTETEVNSSTEKTGTNSSNLKGVSAKPTDIPQGRDARAYLEKLSNKDLQFLLLDLDTPQYGYGLDVGDEVYSLIEREVSKRLLLVAREMRDFKTAEEVVSYWPVYDESIDLAIVAQINARLIRNWDAFRQIRYAHTQSALDVSRIDDPVQKEAIQATLSKITDTEVGSNEFLVDVGSNHIDASLDLLSNRALLLQLTQEGGINDLRTVMEDWILPEAILAGITGGYISFMAVGAVVAYDGALRAFYDQINKRVLIGQMDPEVYTLVTSVHGFDLISGFQKAIVNLAIGAVVGKVVVGLAQKGFRYFRSASKETIEANRMNANNKLSQLADNQPKCRIGLALTGCGVSGDPSTLKSFSQFKSPLEYLTYGMNIIKGKFGSSAKQADAYFKEVINSDVSRPSTRLQAGFLLGRNGDNVDYLNSAVRGVSRSDGSSAALTRDKIDDAIAALQKEMDNVRSEFRQNTIPPANLSGSELQAYDHIMSRFDQSMDWLRSVVPD